MSDCIELVSPLPGKNTVAVQAGDARWEVARAAVEELRLEVGSPLTPTLLAQLQEAATRREAAARALRYLERRPRTVLEMRRWMAQHGYANSVAVPIVRELLRKGLVDDERFARWYVQARLSDRPTGGAALVREMCERGVPREIAEAEAARVSSPEQEASRALVAARKRLPGLRGLPRDRALGRLSRFLSRRGFTDAVVRDVCFRVLEDEPGAHAASTYESET
jgi:regulatory protein